MTHERRVSYQSSRHPVVVAIDGSSRGLSAFGQLLSSLSDDTGMAFVFLQPSDAAQEGPLHKTLRALSSMPVHDVCDGMRLAANRVYLGPGAQLSYVDDVFRVGSAPAHSTPSVRIHEFMRSLAACGRVAVGLAVSTNGVSDNADGWWPPIELDSEPRGHPAPTSRSAAERLVAHLREELAATNAELQVSLAEQDTINTSLRAALAELQSTNEELQVSNEELATGREELLYANELLIAATDEVQMRNAELSQLIHDHVAVVETAGICALLVGRDMRLRRLSPAASVLLELADSDIGRPLGALRRALLNDDTLKVIAEVIESRMTRNVEVGDDMAHYYTLALRPYYSPAGHADGAVLTLTDVTQLRATEDALASADLRIAALELSLRRARDT